MVVFFGMVGEGMETLILLRSDLSNKKATFLSIFFLIFIAVMSFTTIISVHDNCSESAKTAYAESGAGDIVAAISKLKYTEELKNLVETHPMVDRMKVYPAIRTIKVKTGGDEKAEEWMLLKLPEEIKMLAENLNGYEKEVPPLKSGEMYVSQGLMTKMKCNIGDKITLVYIGGTKEMTVKGIVEEPVSGAATIGWKMVYINDEDFDSMRMLAQLGQSWEGTSNFYVFHIYKETSCALSDQEFQRQVNLDTGILDFAIHPITKERVIYYTNLFHEILLSIGMVLIMLLLIIVLIIIVHSIYTGIEMAYIKIGIWKTMGFTGGKIRGIVMLEYLLVETLGATAGMLLSIPLTKAISSVFQPITSILVQSRISYEKDFMFLGIILLISVLIIYITTRKVGTISPVRAIQGGKNEIYFDSRINFPIYQKCLSASLVFRQMLSNKGRYVGIILSASILVFVMMTITVVGNTVFSNAAMEATEEIYTDFDVYFRTYSSEYFRSQIEEVVEDYSEIQKKYYLNSAYFSVNGEKIFCKIFQDPEVITMSEGRAPFYNNEVIVTEILAEKLGVRIGDTVTVSWNGNREEYMISGTFQCMDDTGNNFAMSMEGAKKLGIDFISRGGYRLKDQTKIEEIVLALKNEFSNQITIDVNTKTSIVSETYQFTIVIMEIAIYVLSILFAYVVVTVGCSKIILLEQRDFGVYKALGFTSIQLRLQIALKFFVSSVLGIIIGSIFGILYSGKLLSILLRSVGIFKLQVECTTDIFLVPASTVGISFFVFALLASGRVRRVSIKEMVTE